MTEGQSTSDQLAHVTGLVRYAGDVLREGALHAALVRSTVPHAEIERIDVDEARALPGVVAVLTGQDVGNGRFGRFTRDYPVLALGRVLFIGQPVAAIAAVDQATARRAAELVTVTYQELEAVLTPQEALRAGAPVLHPRYDDYVNAVPDRPGPNVQGSDEVVVGDPDRAFAESDEIYEHTFAWDRSHALPLETHTCLVDASGETVDVWAAHKEPFKLRRDLAAIAGRDEKDFVVHPVKLGGDFGSKGSPFVEAPCYLLSVATGKPVRAVLPISEELTATGARHAGEVTLRTGLRAGRMHVHETRVVLDGGAFSALKPMPKGILPLLGLAMEGYTVEHRFEKSIGCYTNNLPAGHVRSPGKFQMLFAGESHVDLIARARGEDPAAFRARHVADEQTAEVLRRLRERTAGWMSGTVDENGHRLGLGMSVFGRGVGAGESTVRIRATREGVTVLVGVPDQGAGSFQALRGLVARKLHVAEAFVRVVGAPTSAGLDDWGAGASRVSVVVGRACLAACDALLVAMGAHPLTEAHSDWLTRALEERPSLEISGTGSVARDEVGRLRRAVGALAIEVAVDEETGIVRPTRALLVADTGPVLNAVGHRGQLEGGFVYGLSQSLYETLRSTDGRVHVESLMDYKIAGHLDVPPLEIELVDSAATGDGATFDEVGAVGELVNLGVPGALANAISSAVSSRVVRLPLTAERVLAAMGSCTSPSGSRCRAACRGHRAGSGPPG